MKRWNFCNKSGHLLKKGPNALLRPPHANKSIITLTRYLQDKNGDKTLSRPQSIKGAIVLTGPQIAKKVLLHLRGP